MLVAMGLLLAAPAEAQTEQGPTSEQATGFFMQGLIALNFNMYSGYYYGSTHVLPILRLGGQLDKLAVAAEINYSTVNFGTGSSSGGSHLISVGASFQPSLWRSLNSDVHLDLVLGGGAGALIFSGGDTDAYPLGHLNVALGAHYFPSPHFGIGMEPGFRLQFIRAGSDTDDLVIAALLCIAISFEAIIG